MTDEEKQREEWLEFHRIWHMLGPINFVKLSDVDDWAEAQESPAEDLLRVFIAEGKVDSGTSEALAETWLAQRATARSDEYAQRALTASAQSARSTQIAAWWTAGGAVATAAGVLINLLMPSPPPQVLLLPAAPISAATTVGTFLPTKLEAASSPSLPQSPVQLSTAPRSQSVPATPDRSNRPAPAVPPAPRVTAEPPTPKS